MRLSLFGSPASVAPAPGLPGKSAYQLWVEQGHTGTVADFLAAMKGTPGKDGADSEVPGPVSTEPGPAGQDSTVPGPSAADVWRSAGHSGTDADFLAWMRGQDGEDGKDGTDGKDSTVPGPASTVPGPAGDSAYQVWLKAGNTGTEAQFLASLKGAPGKDSTVPGPAVTIARGEHVLAAQLLGGAIRTVDVTLSKAMPSTDYAVIPGVLGWGLSIQSAVPKTTTTVTLVLRNNLLTALLVGEGTAKVTAVG